MWDRLGSHKIKADGTSEAVFVQGISDLVGRGELKHIVLDGAGRQEGVLGGEGRSRRMFVATIPVEKGARLPRRWVFPLP
jgi:hypothetical protein